jgi:hypothetical protein
VKSGTTRWLEYARHETCGVITAKLTAGPFLLDPISFVMSRKTLRTVKRRAKAGTRRTA